MLNNKNYYIMKDYEQALLRADVKVLTVYLKTLKRSIDRGDQEYTVKEIKKLQDYLTVMADTLE